MIGERLEEARKRKGVTIREVAEATKIRGDYLLSMEDNSFNIDLPQIYVRGFLKNYSRYLKLDPNKVLTDYDAHLLGRSPHSVVGTRPSKESFGQMEITDGKDKPSEQVVVSEAPEDEGPEPEIRYNLGTEANRPDSPPPPTLEKKGTRHDQEIWNENKTLYMKIGLVFAGILLVSIILIVLIQLLSGKSDTPEINPEVATSSQQQPVESSVDPALTTLNDDTVIISATDNVTLIVEQTLDRKRLYSGSLNAGETISLDTEGPVSIRFTNGSAISIEKNGQQYSVGQTGVGRTVID